MPRIFDWLPEIMIFDSLEFFSVLNHIVHGYFIKVVAVAFGFFEVFDELFDVAMEVNNKIYQRAGFVAFAGFFNNTRDEVTVGFEVTAREIGVDFFA